MDLAESRSPLDMAAVRSALDDAGWPWHTPDVVEASDLGQVPELLELAGGHELASLVLDSWSGDVGPFSGTALPFGSALVASVLVADHPDDGDPGWLPLLGSLAAADALRAESRVPAEVVWPEGITVPGAMCGGDAGSLQVGSLRTDRIDSGVVLSIVIVVGLSRSELPGATSSIYSEGGRIDRAAILTRLLLELARRVEQWRTDDTALRADYRERCASLGRLTEAPGGRGPASGIDDAGHLIVTVGGEQFSIAPPHRLHGIAKR